MECIEKVPRDINEAYRMQEQRQEKMIDDTVKYLRKAWDKGDGSIWIFSRALRRLEKQLFDEKYAGKNLRASCEDDCAPSSTMQSEDDLFIGKKIVRYKDGRLLARSTCDELEEVSPQMLSPLELLWLRAEMRGWEDENGKSESSSKFEHLNPMI